MGLVIDKTLCIGCGLCTDACSNQALTLAGDVACVDETKCTLCGLCVQSCAQDALRIERGTTSDHSPDARGVWVFAEWEDGLLPVSLELTGCARRLADTMGTQVCVLLPGDPADAPALIAAGADRVFLSDSPLLSLRLEESAAQWICALASLHHPEILLFGATAFGRSLAPRVAARLGTGLTADCSILEIDAQTGNLLQTRPAFGGNLMATIITPHHRPQMATVRAGVMPVPVPDPLRQGEILHPDVPVTPGLVELLQQSRLEASGGIADAPIIISAGRGIGQRRNLKLVYALAEKLGAQVGVSRPLVEMGWARQEQQIGQTGTAVSPKLLIACGISGAVQHLAGISGAETVVAINSDPAAPIFSAADYQIVGDAVTILQTLLDMLNS